MGKIILLFVLGFLLISCKSDYEVGIEYFQQQKLDSAIVYLSKVHNDESEYFNAQKVLKNISRVKDSIKRIDDSIKLSLQDEFNFRTGDSLFNLGEYSRSLDSWVFVLDVRRFPDLKMKMDYADSVKKDSVQYLVPKKVESRSRSESELRNSASKYINRQYDYNLAQTFKKKFGEPRTLAGTNNNVWVVYFSKADITFAINKKNNKVKAFEVGLFENLGLDGSSIKKTDDTYTNVDNNAAWVCIQMSIEKQLAVPSSASFKFGGARDVSYIENGIYTVKSYVDSKNRMGAMIRSNFICSVKMSNNNKSCSIVSLQIQ